jgi:hypothetical protein
MHRTWQSVGVWCAINASRFTDQKVFYKTLTQNWYMNDILVPFFQELTVEEKVTHISAEHCTSAQCRKFNA